jgi:hypothetical protein
MMLLLTFLECGYNTIAYSAIKSLFVSFYPVPCETFQISFLQGKKSLVTEALSVAPLHAAATQNSAAALQRAEQAR